MNLLLNSANDEQSDRQLTPDEIRRATGFNPRPVRNRNNFSPEAIRKRTGFNPTLGKDRPPPPPLGHRTRCCAAAASNHSHVCDGGVPPPPPPPSGTHDDGVSALTLDGERVTMPAVWAVRRRAPPIPQRPNNNNNRYYYDEDEDSSAFPSLDDRFVADEPTSEQLHVSPPPQQNQYHPHAYGGGYGNADESSSSFDLFLSFAG